ncbi:guanitoxin biosynthesis heme-dependent pre-guanitoxin N-hydroxylase GntA [Streptomyces sp. NPDC006617]|uniref:guanitoxin biosynthesis heme-dependent pre-guanitoxin N-hydroxylase GntA n=1 Tax=Streptomyces sp. NPDC006617 TaxID=3155354 RepID=UPI0033A59B35
MTASEAHAVHEEFRSLVLGGTFPCLGGASALRRGQYRFGWYPLLGSAEAASECAGDLTRFVTDFPEQSHPVAVHVAVFEGPGGLGEEDFEALLWQQLRGMRLADGTGGCADDPAGAVQEEDAVSDPGFYFGHRNFFVVGIHPGASRAARTFRRPALVFNALSHMGPLRRAGSYTSMQDKIRSRDRRLQGSVNPSLQRPRVAQFSGREVFGDWKCPVDMPEGRQPHDHGH